MARIVFVGAAHPYRGGLAAFNERLCRELQNMGHEVEIITFTLQYPSFLFPGKTQFSSDPAPTDLKIERRIHSMSPLNWMAVGNEVRNRKPDLLLFKFWMPFMGPCFGTIARRMNKKQTAVIAILDNVIPHEKRPGDSLLTRYFLSACQGFVTMSSTVTRDLKPYLGNKPVHQQPHPIYDHFGETLEKAEAKRLLNLDPQFHYLLFFGFIRKYKGLDLAIEAMADERIKKLPVKLLVAGEFYEEATPYHELIKKYNLSDRIVFHSHFIAEGEVKKYFSAADLVIQPYRSATQSGVTQVAFHFNRPVIVTQVGSLPEMVKDGMNGFCTHPSPDAVASAIARFFELDAEARFTAFINEDKKHLGWQTFAEALWKLAQHLLTRGLVN